MCERETATEIDRSTEGEEKREINLQEKVAEEDVYISFISSTCCSVLQCVAVYRSVLQCVAV